MIIDVDLEPLFDPAAPASVPTTLDVAPDTGLPLVLKVLDDVLTADAAPRYVALSIAGRLEGTVSASSLRRRLTAGHARGEAWQLDGGVGADLGEHADVRAMRFRCTTQGCPQETHVLYFSDHAVPRCATPGHGPMRYEAPA
jgi:hypothetical protein